MKRINFRKTLSAAALMGGAIVTTNALAQSQGGYGQGSGMMGGNGGGWMGGDGSSWMGGYGGGILLPLLLVIVVAGLVAWAVAQKRK